jgi:hypothetical protein
MTRSRAVLTAAILFGGVCLMLGTLGTMLIESGNVLLVYGAAVLGFATWVSLETYRDCRAEPRHPKPRGKTAIECRDPLPSTSRLDLPPAHGWIIQRRSQ